MKNIILVWMIIIPTVLFGQPDQSHLVFDDKEIATVRITMTANDLNYMYANPYSDSLYPCTIYFRNSQIEITVPLTGIRIRGDSSRDAVKKSFKISFDKFIKGRKLYNLKEINLNGEHNDPTVMRSKISWDLYKNMDMVSPRASHAEVYINNKYYGLYLNVEQIDKEFLIKNYEDPTGNLWKCLHQASLNYRDDDPNSYKFLQNNIKAYDLQTNKEFDDYSKLAYLIDVINNTPDNLFFDSLSKIISIEDIMKHFSCDILSGNWDDFWYGWNNYYLYYNPGEKLFRFIPYDYDNSFGITFTTYSDYATRDIYNWRNINKIPKLYTRIMNTPKLRNLLTHFLEFYSTQVFNLNKWERRSDSLKEMITPYAEKATIKDWGFTNKDFHNSYDYTGYFFDKSLKMRRSIKEFVNVRNTSLTNQLKYLPAAPVVYKLSVNKNVLLSGDSLTIKSSIFSNTNLKSVKVELENDGSIVETHLLTYQPVSGTNDLSKVDRWKTKFIPTSEWSKSKLRLVVEDIEGSVTQYPENGILLQKVNYLNGNIFINEIMSNNTSTVKDEYSEYEDWLEIYNNSDSSFNIGGMFLTDDKKNLTKFRIPDETYVEAKSYYVFWCDNNVSQGSNHTNFGFSASGEFAAIVEKNGITIVDSVTFPALSQDVSYGRNLDLDFEWHYFVNPTPFNSNNKIGKSKTSEVIINEIMSGNTSVIKDEYEEFEDWIEIYNPQDTIVNLGGKFITDDKRYLGKWRFPDNMMLEPKGYLLLWCDNQIAQGNTHTNFKLSSEGEYLAIIDNDAITIVDSVSFPAIPINSSFGRYLEVDSLWHLFSFPTPNYSNYRVAKDETSEVLINEIMSSNISGIQDENGEYEDWIEIYNPQDTIVNLSKKFLTDDRNNLEKWQFPDGLFLDSKDYLLLWCDDQISQGVNHTNFKLSSSGEFLAIMDNDALTIVDSVAFPPLPQDVSYGRNLDQDSYWHFFVHPTPNASNYKIGKNKTSEVLINEVMSDNTNLIKDEYGEYEDWIEIYNPQDTTVDLNNKYFTDDKRYLGKWRFPENLKIAPKDYLLLWCDDQTIQGVNHTNFKLSATGEFLAILADDAVTIVDSVTYPIIPSNSSYGRNIDVDSIWHLFSYPTPNRSNNKVARDQTSEVLINEVMSSNISVITDEFGEYEDWVEIYNPQDTTVNLSKKFLTDDKNIFNKWQFPDSLYINSNDYLLLWCDGQTNQGNNHINFKLSQVGEYLAIMDNDALTIVDSVTVVSLEDNQSYARDLDNNFQWFISNNPTPQSANFVTSIKENLKNLNNEVVAYPNPFNPSTTISYTIKSEMNIFISIYDMLGKLVWDFKKDNVRAGSYNIVWNGKDRNGANLSSGIYFLKMEGNNFSKSVKLLLLR